jgi:hypothetical protein
MQTTRIWRNPTEQDLSTHTTKIEDIKELNLTAKVEKYQQMLCQINSLCSCLRGHPKINAPIYRNITLWIFLV